MLYSNNDRRFVEYECCTVLWQLVFPVGNALCQLSACGSYDQFAASKRRLDGRRGLQWAATRGGGSEAAANDVWSTNAWFCLRWFVIFPLNEPSSWGCDFYSFRCLKQIQEWVRFTMNMDLTLSWSNVGKYWNIPDTNQEFKQKRGEK